MLKIREKTASRCRCATACSRTEHRCKQALIAACCVVLCYDVLSCVVMCGREAVHLAPHLNEAEFGALLAAAVQVPSGDAHRHNNSHLLTFFPAICRCKQGLKKNLTCTARPETRPVVSAPQTDLTKTDKGGVQGASAGEGGKVGVV